MSEPSRLRDYLSGVKEHVTAELQLILPKDHKWSAGLYEVMRDYPLRGGKTLRPALCIALCRSLGGQISAVRGPAAILELYHNAFLVHDDVEDGSLQRRGKATLHEMYGSPIAVNVGDGMLAVCMQALLENTQLLGVGKTLNIFDTMTRMSRETAEGQMMELQWIRSVDWSPTDREYVRMVHKKTAWYSFIAPMLVGQTCASERGLTKQIFKFASLLGIAFQIKDDLLNLRSDATGYGKEHEGDLWEGKHTLMLCEALRKASKSEKSRAEQILAKDRRIRANHADIEASLTKMLGNSEVDDSTVNFLVQEIADQSKTEEDVGFLRYLVDKYQGMDHAEKYASRYARAAEQAYGQLTRGWPDSSHKTFLSDIVQYVITREE